MGLARRRRHQKSPKRPSRAALQWLLRHQQSDGNWRLDDKRFPDKGMDNDIAGTAFGLLPFLGRGQNAQAAKDNPYDKPIERALLYLMKKQDSGPAYFGGTTYGHALATIAICEAYGLTQDPGLRRPPQMAINFIVQCSTMAAAGVIPPARRRRATRPLLAGRSWL